MARDEGATASTSSTSTSSSSSPIEAQPRGQRQRVLRMLRVAGVTALALRIVVPIAGRAVRALFRRRGGKGAARSPPDASSSVLQGLPNQDAWSVVDASLPAFPPDYQEVASAQLGCSVHDFYLRFICGESPFMRNFHVETEKQYDFVCRGWRTMTGDSSLYEYQDDQSVLAALNESPFERVLGAKVPGSYGRTLSLRQPKKPPAQVDADVRQRQQFAVFRGDVLVVATVSNMLNIPFKHCFTVNTLWDVRPTLSGGCTVSIRVKVHFIQRTLMAGIIRVTTFRDTTGFYKRLLASCTENLQTQAVPPRFTAGTAVQRLTARGGGGGGGAGGGGLIQGPDGQLLQLPTKQRRLRVLVMLMVLAGSILHQLSLHYDLDEVRRQALGPRK